VALVVLLRGVNVGGHRTFRPSALANQLQHLDVVNIGAAGTFVVRKPVSHAKLLDEVASLLPFDTQVVICSGSEIVRLLSFDFFAAERTSPDIVRFVTVLSQSPRSAPATPLSFPSSGKWLVKILARENRFVIGMYRRHMKAIGYLGALEKVFGVPATTRNWNTMMAIAKAAGN
jgi:uncharacterized protein (DUF1697 family)